MPVRQYREIIDEDSVQALKLQVRGYMTTDPSLPEASDQSDENQAQAAIAHDIFDTLRGSDNLIFANERVNVEVYADLLAGNAKPCEYRMSSSLTTAASPKSCGSLSRPVSRTVLNRQTLCARPPLRWGLTSGT